MPLGAFRLNSLARYIAPSAPAYRTALNLTAYGNAQLEASQKIFGPTSVYFDGNGDYIISDTLSALAMSGDFTIEFWTRANASGDYNFVHNRVGGAYTDGSWTIRGSGTTITLSINGMSNITTSISSNTWTHFAIVRSGSTVKLYKNGTSVGSQTYTGTLFETHQQIILGAFGSGVGDFLLGHIDELRISNVARYTSNFSTASSAFVNDDDTLCLFHFDGTDGSTSFPDDNLDRAPKYVNLYGNANYSTAQKKIGAGSLSLDGNGDYINISYATDIGKWNASTGYTLEYWVRLNSLSGTSYPDGATHELPSSYGNHAATNNVNYWSFGPVDNGNVVFFYYNGGKVTTQTSGVTLSTNTWYHLAFVYDAGGNSYKIYVDGTQRASATVSGTPQFSASYPITLGAAGSTTQYMNAYIDELRVSTTARYNSNFTPSTSAFQNDADTVLLIHADSDVTDDVGG